MTDLRLGRRTFDMGRVIGRTFTTIGDNAGVFFATAPVLAGGPTLVITVAQWLMVKSMLSGTERGPMIWSLLAVGWTASIIGAALLQAMIVKTSVASLEGREANVSRAYEAGVSKILPLLGVALVSTLAIVLGLFLLIVPGVILMVLWAVAVPAVVVENLGVADSLQRSRELTRGNRWNIFGLGLIYVVVAGVVNFVIGFIGGTIGQMLGGMDAGFITRGVASLIVSIFGAILASAGVAALYHELRTVKEGHGAIAVASAFD